MKNLADVLEKFAFAPKLNGMQYKVMLIMLSQIERMGEDVAILTNEMLSRLTGLHKNHISSTISELVKNGYLNKEKYKGNLFAYTLGEYFSKKEDSEK